MTDDAMTDDAVSDSPISDDAMTVDMWSDVVCPWCCIGRAHLLRALDAFDGAEAVRLTWRSFELDPSAPRIAPGTLHEQLERKFGSTPAEVDGMLAGVAARGAEAGLDFRFDRARSGSTLDAHRLLHAAKASGHQDALKDRLFRAYFTEGAAIGDPSTLAGLAKETGLDPVVVDEVLGSDQFLDAVRADEAQAQALRVSGVPYFVIDRRYAVAGAQPANVLAGALQRAWSDRTSS